jgi:hypothetical protein
LSLGYAVTSTRLERQASSSRRSLWAALGALWLTGCSAPDLPDGRFACSSTDDCPGALRCVEGRCRGVGGLVASSPDPVLTADGGSVAEPGEDAGEPAEAGAGTAEGGALDAGLPADSAIAPCTRADDCYDGDSCTADTCVDGNCAWPAVANCCTGPEQCRDDDPCTNDDCDFATHTCPHDKKDGCCASDRDCPSAGCSKGSCDTTHHSCVYASSVGCCQSASQCEDFNVCTDNLCTPDGSCAFAPRKDCCQDQAQCEDGDACTVDTCDLATGACKHVMRVCDDNDPCTTNTCDARDGCQFPRKDCGTGCCVGGACYGASESKCTQATPCALACTCCDYSSGLCQLPRYCAILVTTNSDPFPPTPPSQ